MKKIHSVSFRINLLILILCVVIGGGLITAAYVGNRRQVDDLYKTRTSQTSATIAANLDPAVISSLADIVMTDEYQVLRAEAEEAEDDALIERYLEEKGLLSDVRKLLESLASYRDLQGAKYVYLQDVMADTSVNLADADEPLTYIGTIEKNAEEFEGFTSNTHIDPTVSYTEEYGWLCSTYDPVLNDKGEAVCLVGVDIEMTDIINTSRSFLWKMLTVSAFLVLGMMLLIVLMISRTVTRPLSMLSRATDEFADPTVEYSRKKVIDLPIASKDEIGDLYQKTRNMQQNLLEYMDNLTKVTAEKEQIRAELNVATQIQADMLPRIFPAFPNRQEFDIYATMDPAKEVGGDFYDFFLVDDDHLAVVVADVSGKGVPAALFMVIAKTLIKNRAQMGGTPAEILQDVNSQLCEGNDAELFVTVWLGILEISTGKGLSVNAGHEHPVIRRGDGAYELVTYRHSAALAVMPGMKFREREFMLNPGDAFFIYTDGVPEATSETQEFFGADRMLKALNDHRDLKPAEMLPVVRNEISAFVREAPQFDDITMVMLEYFGPKISGENPPQ